MTRAGILGFALATAASAAVVQAQDSAAGAPRDATGAKAQPATVTLVGCVRPGVSPVGTSGAGTTAAAGQFVLSDIAAGVAASSSAGAATSSNAGATSSNRADQRTGGDVAATAGSTPRQIILEGAAVAPHLNQRVEVTGIYVQETAAGTARTGTRPAGDTPTGAGDTATGKGVAATPPQARDQRTGDRTAGVEPAPGKAQRFQVTAVKQVVGTCGPQ